MRKKILVLAMCLCVGAATVACSEQKPANTSTANQSAESVSGSESNAADSKSDNSKTDDSKVDGSDETSSAGENSSNGEEKTDESGENTTETSDENLNNSMADVFSDGLDDNGFLKDVKAADYAELTDYKSMKTIPSSEVKPSDDEIQTEIDNVVGQYATVKQVVDRAVKDGDVINIDYTGYVGGTAFAGGSSTDFTYDPTKITFIDGFYEQIIGHTPSEDKFTITATFPEDYHEEDLKGKEAQFDIVLHYIEEKESPAFDDAFVKDTLKLELTADQYRQQKADELQKSNSLQYVFKQITDQSKAKEVPKELIEKERKTLDTINEMSAGYQGKTLDEFYKDQGVTEEDIVEYCTTQVEQQLVIQAIAEKENIQVTEEDLTEYFGEQLQDVIDYYGQGYATRMVLPKVVIGKLIDQMTVES